MSAVAVRVDKAGQNHVIGTVYRFSARCVLYLFAGADKRDLSVLNADGAILNDSAFSIHGNYCCVRQ